MSLTNRLLNLARQVRRFDNSFWGKADTSVLKPGLVFREGTQPFKHHRVDGLEPEAKEALEKCNLYSQEETLWDITGDIILEPSRAWAITSRKNIFWQAIPFSEMDQPPRPWFFRYQLLPKKITKVPALISCRYWIHNYFHFYNDFLGGLTVLEKLNVDPAIPIVVPEFIFQGKLFQSIYRRSRHLKTRPLLIQKKDDYFQTQRALFPKVSPNQKVLFEKVLEDLSIPVPPSQATEKIFLVRSFSKQRHLTNAQEIQTIATKHGLTCIETGRMSPEAQEELFRRARVVVGVHGAGLLNIIFRRGKPLDLLEIFPKNFYPPHYYWLAQEYGYGYDAFTAEPEVQGAFTINPLLFENKLKAFLNKIPTSRAST